MTLLILRHSQIGMPAASANSNPKVEIRILTNQYGSRGCHPEDLRGHPQRRRSPSCKYNCHALVAEVEKLLAGGAKYPQSVLTRHLTLARSSSAVMIRNAIGRASGTIGLLS